MGTVVSMLAITALLLPTTCAAVTWDLGGVGYVANLPNQPMGLSLFAARERGLGFYVDFKFGRTGEPWNDFFMYEDATVEESEEHGHEHLQDSYSRSTFNFGLTSGLSQDIAVYYGVGYSFQSKYVEYHDPLGLMGDDGDYWLEAESESGVNFVFGVLVGISDSFGFQAGGETRPLGISVGLFVRGKSVDKSRRGR